MSNSRRGDQLPHGLAVKFWSRLQVLDSMPPAERLEAFRSCARDLVRLVGKRLSAAGIADRLREYAIAAGLVDICGEDAVQGVLEDVLKTHPQPLNSVEKDVDARPPEFSDEALAIQFTERYGHKLRYVAAWDKWMIWTGTCWRSDETLEVFSLARELCSEIASTCAQEKKQEKNAAAIASKKTISAVVTLARVDRRIAAKVGQWDVDPWLLNTPTGAIDLRTAILRAHNPYDYCTKMTAVAPDASCPTPLWQAFHDRASGGVGEYISFIQRVLGYALTGVTQEHALFFCYGTGANGKSTLVNTVIDCVGDYHRTAAIETFTASSTERHPTDLAGLRGARLVTAVETEEGRRWAESKIKSLTGGDKITARFMRQDFFDFTPSFKLLIAGNHKPGLRSVDEAIRRRFHLLPFLAVIPPEQRDEKLGEKLKAEGPGILAWMIQGCLDWQRRRLDPPTIVQEATAEYLEAEDALAAWIDEAGHRDPNAFELTIDLFDSWKKYAHESGEYIGSARKFAQKLDDRSTASGLRRGRDSTGRRGFYGLRLRSSATQQAPDDVVPA